MERSFYVFSHSSGITLISERLINIMLGLFIDLVEKKVVLFLHPRVLAEGCYFCDSYRYGIVAFMPSAIQREFIFRIIIEKVAKSIDVMNNRVNYQKYTKYLF